MGYPRQELAVGSTLTEMPERGCWVESDTMCRYVPVPSTATMHIVDVVLPVEELIDVVDVAGGWLVIVDWLDEIDCVVVEVVPD